MFHQNVQKQLTYATRRSSSHTSKCPIDWQQCAGLSRHPHPFVSKEKKTKTMTCQKSFVALKRKQCLGGYHGVVEPAFSGQAH